MNPRTKRLLRLWFAKKEPGTCRVCGCTMTDPCWNPSVGFCWWADAEETICSHCAHADLFDAPETVHCVNSGKPRI